MSSSYVDPTGSAVEHCQAMAKTVSPEMASKYYVPMAQYLQDKLWHQLTCLLLDFVVDPAAAELRDEAGLHAYLALYNKVVLSVENKLNPVSLARLAAAVATALAPHDAHASKAILENLLAKHADDHKNKADAVVAPQGQEATASLGVPATVYLQSKLNLLTLQALHSGGDAVMGDTTKIGSDADQLESIKALIKKDAALLTTMSATEQVSVDQQALVYAAHYEMAMTYYKTVGPPEAFYEQALSFLNYAPPPAAGAPVSPASAAFSLAQYRQLAVDLCLAALVGDGVYNLGQVVEQQKAVLALLTTTPGDTEYAWLVELLQACADGDVTGFGALSQKYAAQIQQQPALVNRATFVQEKLLLLALVHLCFSRKSHADRMEADDKDDEDADVFENDSHHRTVLTLTDIAEHLQIPLDQVEWVVMRAFSVHLLEGSMDQVTGRVHVTWVLPRVLNAQQIAALSRRFGKWAVKVDSTRKYMQEQTPTFA